MKNSAKWVAVAGAAVAILLAAWSSLNSGEGDCCAAVAHAQEKHHRLGGDLIPVRTVIDPFPVFNGIAVDPDNNLLVMTDVNRKSILAYERTAAATNAGDRTPALRQTLGPETNIGFVTGVLLDPLKHEIFAVNNDIEDTMVVMPYGSEGNQAPKRLLSVPHQAWGVSLGRTRNEICLTVELHNAVVFYRREASGVEPPRRAIRGADTELADPHGIYWDERHKEIVVANHGNYRGLFRNAGGGCIPTGTADPEGGEFKAPSINVYPADGQGNQKPLRKIQGAHTQLDFPMGLAVDEEHDEIAVANNGDNSILIFKRSSSGDAAPVRVIAGDGTGLARPMGIAYDAKNNEIWVSNFGDHTAVAFDRAAAGNAHPKRVIRTAPAGTPVSGFGNPQTVAYDSKRQEILVPN